MAAANDFTGYGAVRFRCSGNDTTFCLHPDATCSVDAGGQVCDCPAGYQHDYVFAHQPSCTLPTWYLPVLFGVTTFGLAWAGFILGRASLQLKKTVKHLAHVCLTIYALEWLHVLCVFLQGANLEAGIFFGAIMAMSMLYLVDVVVMIITRPVYAALKRPIQRWRRTVGLTCFFIGFSNSIVMLISIGFIRDERNRGVYNSFLATAYILVGSSHFYLVLLIYVRVLGLEKMVRDVVHQNSQNVSSGNKKLGLFLQQLKSLKMVLALDFCNTLTIGEGVCMFVLGAFPYQFVLWSIFCTSLWPTTPFLIRFLRSKNADQTGAVNQSGSTNKSEQRNVADASAGNGAGDMKEKERKLVQNRVTNAGISNDGGGMVAYTGNVNLAETPVLISTLDEKLNGA